MTERSGAIFSGVEGVENSAKPQEPPQTLLHTQQSQNNHNHNQFNHNNLNHKHHHKQNGEATNHHQSAINNKTKKKIRLIIPRKRKLNEIDDNTNSMPISSASNTNNFETQEPAQKKQRLSPKNNENHNDDDNNNDNDNDNDDDNDINMNNSPHQQHKPQPPHIQKQKQTINTNPMENDNNNNNNNNNNDKEEALPLPPPPPLQSISPPPPLSRSPISPNKKHCNPSFAVQLQTHYKWPTHNPQGLLFTHFCQECGQGFMSGNALGGHKGKHKRERDRAIRQSINGNRYNQYYYPHNNNNHNIRNNTNNNTNNGYKILNGVKIPIKTHNLRPKQSTPLENYSKILQKETSHYVYQTPKKRTRRNDPHNRPDANGNYPTHDIDGNIYTHICETCGKGFSNGSALGGHRSVHKRMEKMGKMYNKLTGKHQYIKGGFNKTPIINNNNNNNDNNNDIGKSRTFLRPKRNNNNNINVYSSSPQSLIKSEYTGLSDIEIMNGIMDKLWDMDTEKFFHSEDVSKEYKLQVTESLSFGIIRAKIKDNKYTSVQQDFMADINKLFRFVFNVYNNNDPQYKSALKLKQFAYKQTMVAMAPQHSQQHQKQENHPLASSSMSSLISTTSTASGTGSIASAPAINHNLPGQYRLNCLPMDGYEKIEDYEFFCDSEVLTEKMSCKKTVHCDGKWCHDYNNLGPYCIHEEQWKSQCFCRSKQMECTNECKCDPLQCKNRAISSGNFRKLNESIREQEVYGIDQHTRMCIEKALPTQIKDIYINIDNPKSHFIENILCPAINNYNFFVIDHPEFKSKYDPSIMIKPHNAEAPFMITDVLRSMLYSAEQNKDKDDGLCRILSFILRLILNMGTDQLTNEISGIERSKRRMNFECDSIVNIDSFLTMYNKTDFGISGEDIICHEEFPIYSKGTGVICIDSDGIKCNEYIISFLGIVYSPWCWYEKDDRTRWLVKSRGAQKQPEFFNIMLERHKDDPNGYDLMFIDPSKKGNYGSRLSHSCSPNCISVSMGVNDKYRIAVYASRDIKYGEELCFNYNSVTENEQEWQDAVCLCGTTECHGQFLIYAGTQLYTEVMKKEHHLMHRTANLLNASIRDNYNKLDNIEQELLNKYCLKESILNGIPIWMKKYAASICKYIDYEQDELPKELTFKAQSGEKGYAEFNNLENATEESKGLKYVRLSNLVITLNKMSLFFRQTQNKNLINLPLFRLFEPKELIEKIWFNTNSIISDLSLYITIYEGDNHYIIRRINEIRSNQSLYLPFTSNGIELSRSYLFELREELLKLPPKPNAYHHAASDILLFYASTRYFFYFYPPYQGFQSFVFTYNELGYDKTGYPPPKKYAQQYVWGQLNFWERHTIESPDSSLSAERRGTITLPNINCCYIKPRFNGNRLQQNKIHRRLYNYNIRKQIIQHIQYKNQSPWSTKWHFGFKNGGLYGSPWLDSYIDPKNEEENFNKFIKTMKETKMIYPDGTYISMEDDEDNEHEDDENNNNKQEIIKNNEHEIECKTNSTNPNHISNISNIANLNDNDNNNNDNNDGKSTNNNRKKQKEIAKPTRRSNRLRGKATKSYVEPKI